MNGLVRPPSSCVCYRSATPTSDLALVEVQSPVKRGFFLPRWIGHWFPSVCAVWFDQHCMFLGVRLLSGNLLWVGPRLEVRCEPAGLTSRECVLTGVRLLNVWVGPRTETTTSISGDGLV